MCWCPVALERAWRRTVRCFLYLFIYLKFFMCMGISPACISVNHLRSWCLAETRRGYQTPWNWSYSLTIVRHHVGAWDLNPNSLKEQQALLTAESSLESLFSPIFLKHCVIYLFWIWFGIALHKKSQRIASWQCQTIVTWLKSMTVSDCNHMTLK